MAVRAAGFTGDSAALGDSLLDAILATPNGVTFTVEDHTDTWSRVRGGQVNLAIPSLLEQVPAWSVADLTRRRIFARTGRWRRSRPGRNRMRG